MTTNHLIWTSTILPPPPAYLCTNLFTYPSTHLPTTYLHTHPPSYLLPTYLPGNPLAHPHLPTYHSFIYPPTHPPYLLTHLPIYLPTHPPTYYPFTYLLIYLPTDPPTYLATHPPACLPNPHITHQLTYPFTHLHIYLLTFYFLFPITYPLPTYHPTICYLPHNLVVIWNKHLK